MDATSGTSRLLPETYNHIAWITNDSRVNPLTLVVVNKPGHQDTTQRIMDELEKMRKYISCKDLKYFLDNKYVIYRHCQFPTQLISEIAIGEYGSHAKLFFDHVAQ